ncbi:MAG: tetratricopeptide repeat protein, partial [Tatlockia sp.]|nr:tetratricopeptide repeat protein [Tatlockia sp.]
MNLLKTIYRAALTITLLFATSNLFTVFAITAQQPVDGEKIRQTSNDNEPRRQQEDVELTLGKPIERNLAGNEAHSYKIVLAANQYLHIVVEQRGIDVVVALFAPDGKKIAEVDSPNGTQGEEPISIVAEAAGSYRLEVRSPDAKVEAGRYNVKIEELRASDNRDKPRISALILSNEAALIASQDAAESRTKAIEKYEEALLLFRAINDSENEAATLNNIGDNYRLIHKTQKALEYFRQGLQIFQSDRNQLNEGRTLRIIGMTYFELGEYQTALGYFEKALPIFKLLGDSNRELSMYVNIEIIYEEIGEFDKALDYNNKALAIYQRNNNQRGIGDTLISFGTIYWRLNEYQKSIDYFNKALSIHKSLSDSGSEAISLVDLGFVYAEFDPQKSINYFDKALLLFQANQDNNGISQTYLGYGRAYYKLGDQEKALENLNKALLLATSGSIYGDALSRYNIARVELKSGNLENALTQIETAINIIESSRAKVGNNDFRASYFATKQYYYELYIDILTRLHKQQPTKGYDAKALQASERARARSLLETLAEANADIRQGVDTILLERERSIQQLLAGKSERLTRISNDEQLKAQKPAAEKEVNDLLAQYQEVEAQIRVKSPRYAALTQPVPSNLAEIQRLLDKDIVLIEYALGEEHSYLWLVTPQSLKSYELPKRSQIEETANRVIAGITGQNNVPPANNIEYQK